jgi:hypothetical protein
MEPQSMDNLDLWDKVSHPPKHALKQIGAGRLKGMTDVNPQYRIKAMTEHFGKIGIGWYYEIHKIWTEPGNAGELMAFVQINLYIKDGESWSMPIIGLGGSALVAKESAGLRANDEGYKMALTDALSVAMKQLGIASAIYEGLWDGSKYRDVTPQKETALDLTQYETELTAANTIDELRDAWGNIPPAGKKQLEQLLRELKAKLELEKGI